MQGIGEETSATDFCRLERELEQSRVLAEDNAALASRCAAECRRLQSELDALLHSGETTSQQLAEVRARLHTALGEHLAERARQGSTEEELTVAVEQLHVLTGKLHEANASLKSANEELERRVDERTAALATASAAVRDREGRLRLALEQARACTWEWTCADDTLYWAGEYAALFGRPLSEAPSTSAGWVHSAQAEDQARLAAALRDCAEGRSDGVAVDYRVLVPGLGPRWLSSRGRCVGSRAQGTRQVLGLTLDISEQRRAANLLERANAELNRRVAEEVAAREAAQSRLFQKQKLEALGQVAGGVAHDFNNLLGVISNSAQLLALAPGDAEKTARASQRILEAAMRGAELTGRLLSFGRRQALNPRLIDMASTVPEIRDLLRHCLVSSVALECEIADDVWPVWADPNELQLALLNLAVNARDAMPRGGTLVLRVRNRLLDAPEAAAHDLAPGPYVELTLADDGCGMPPDLIGKAFEPFFTTKDVGAGTGLGLAQVYGFARQSGGTARLDSVLGRGTTVTLLLPRAHGDDVQSHADRAAGAAPATPRTPASILVVEDDEVLAPLVCDMLRHLGHRTTRVSTPRAALRVLESGEAVDLVFTDVLLPAGMNGIEFADGLAQRYPGLPVALTTGYSGVLATAHGDRPLLRKPYRIEDLDALIRNLLPTRPADAAPPSAPPLARTHGEEARGGG